MRKNHPALILSVLLATQSALFYGLSRPEPVALSGPLREFPTELGAWRMTRESILDPEVRETLRADDYLSRDYVRSPAQTASLFVAFFKSQRAGQSPHSPKNCLPGSGWIWSVSDTIRMTVPDRATPVEINRYIVSKGDERALVLYWYQSRDRVVASEYRAAAFVAWDALRYNRTDTALVRIVVPVSGNHEDLATKTGTDFVRAIFATLRQFFPR